MTEEQALRQMQRGSQEALAWFIDRYGAYVSAVIRGILGTALAESDVEETASDVFFSLWNNAGKVHSGAARPWLSAVARNAARDRLINDVVNYAGRDMGAIVVFDAADNELSEGSRTKIGGVQVIFSPAGQSADKVIEKLAYDAGKRGVETMVVTSDAAIQDTVFGGGVDRMSADGFSHEMGEYYEDARLDDTPKVARKNTVAERIPADTLARLKALRDGR